MKFGARVRFAIIVLTRRNVELVHCHDGHEAAKNEETLQSIQVERDRRGDGFQTWAVEPHMRVHVPWWFQTPEATGALAVVKQTMGQTVAVLRWDS